MITLLPKEIDGQPGYYVSAEGWVWSNRANRIIVGTLCGQMGYRAIQFPDGSRRYIHEIVCSTFHGPRPSGQQVRHLNGSRADNRAANLAWGTKAENEADKIAHGTTPKGERNPMARLNRGAVNRMRQIRAETGQSFAVIASSFGVSTMTAFRAITGENWK
jgi:hypothetical protein